MCGEKWLNQKNPHQVLDGMIVARHRRMRQEDFKSRRLNFMANQMCNSPEGVSDEMCSRFQEVITGDATAEDVCEAMQAKFEELAG